MEREYELCAGQIIVNAKRVYYLPHDVSLPALRFHADQQKFVALDDRKKEDFALCTTLRDMAQRSHHPCTPQKVTTHYYSDNKKATRSRAAHSRVPTDTVSIDESIPCEALYGVLPINDTTSVLLYVSEKVLVDEISTNTVSAFSSPHRIYAVRKLDWMRLPSSTTRDNVVDDEEADNGNDAKTPGKEEGGRKHKREGGDDADKAARSSPSTTMSEEEEEEEGGEGNNDETSDQKGDLNNSSMHSAEKTEQTIDEYLDVIDRFCKRVEQENNNYFIPHYLSHPLSQKSAGSRLEKTAYTAGGSFLFYSPTLNLSLPSASLIRQATVADGTAKSSAKTEEREEKEHSSSSDDEAKGTICAPTVELDEKYNDIFNWNYHLVAPKFCVPTKKDLLEKLTQQGKTEPDEMALLHRSTCTFADAESTSLLIPSFVRGYVGSMPVAAAASGKRHLTLLFLSRLSRRWSGTRYNRRGLEPNGSGVVANMCITTVLLFQKEANRIAAFDILRGSVPRYWEQPANLSFKPTIKIQSPYTCTGEASGSRKNTNASVSSCDTTNGSDLLHSGSGSPDASHAGLCSPVLGSGNPNVVGVGSSGSGNANTAAGEFYLHFHLLTQLFPHISRYVILDTLSTSKLEKPLADNFYASFCRLREEESSTFSCAKEVEVRQGSEKNEPGLQSSVDRLAFICHSKFNPNTSTTTTASTDAKTVLIDYIKYNVKKKMKQFDYQGMLQDVAQQIQIIGKVSGNAPSVGGGAAAEEEEEEKEGKTSPLNFSLYEVVRVPHKDAAAPACVLRALHQQETLARVNCLDCLDRTNLIQSICARMLYEDMVHAVGRSGETHADAMDASPVDDRPLRYMFAQQGYAISHLYSNYTFHFENYLLYGKKNNRMDMAKGGVIAMSRYVYQNFTDGKKQDAVSLLTHQHSPFSVFYYFDIETPFSRDFKSMNTQVLIGIVVGCIPFFYSLWSILLSPHKNYLVDDAGRDVMEYNDFGKSSASSSSSRSSSSSWANNPLVMNKLHFTFVILWVIYFFFIFQKLKRYRCTFTNRPLLSYNA